MLLRLMLGYSCVSAPLCVQVRMQALKCFSVLAYENTQVSITLVNGENPRFIFSALLCSSFIYFVSVDSAGGRRAALSGVCPNDAKGSTH